MTSGASSADLAEQIRSLRAASNAALAARDPDGVVSFMDDTIAVGVAGGPVLRGLAANRAAWDEQMREAAWLGYVRTPEHVLVGADQRRAAERGRWVGRWRAGAGVHEQRGTYTAEWRLTEIGWRLVRETFVAVR